jgi:hypothetical protein
MIPRTPSGHSIASRNFSNRGGGPGFAQRVKEAQSIDSTLGRAKALEALAKEINTWQDVFALSRARDALLPAFQRDVDKALFSALAQMQTPIAAALSDHDPQALEQFIQRFSQPDTQDQQAQLHQLLEPPIRRHIDALMNQCFPSNPSLVENYIERIAPLSGQIPSLERYIADIKDILSYSWSAPASAVAVNNTAALAPQLPADIWHLIALRLQRRVTFADTRDDFNERINDILSFGLICKLFHDGAQRCAIPQALALRLSFAGLPHMLKAFQATIDTALSGPEARVNSKQWALLSAAQQSVVRGYLKYTQQKVWSMGTPLNKAIVWRKTIAPHTGITHPLGVALIAYAHRVHRFPIAAPEGQPNEFADNQLSTWKALERVIGKTVGALVEELIALAAHGGFNKRGCWHTSPATPSFYVQQSASLEDTTATVMAAQADLNEPLLISGIQAIAAILLAAHQADAPPAIEPAQIDATLDFLVHYTALGYAIPASAQEALAQVIVHVGMNAQQSAKLRTCLQQAHNAKPEWT